MSAPDPAASEDYSRAPWPFRRARRSAGGASGAAPDADADGACTPAGRTSAGARWATLALGLGGGALLIAAEFATLYIVRASTGAARVQERVLGHDQHAYALALIGLAGGGLALGAARASASERGRAAASVAVAALGLLALMLGAVGDRGDVRAAGLLSHLYDSAAAQPGAGYRLELVGAIMLLLAGVLALLAVPARGRRRYQR